MKTLLDSLGQPINTGELVITSVNERFSVGVIDRIEEKESPYVQGISIFIIHVRRIELFENGSVSHVINSPFRYESKLTIVESFDFLPQKFHQPIKAALAI